MRAERAPTYGKTCLSARGRYRLNLAAEREAAEAKLYRDNGSGDLGTMELLRHLTAPPRAVVSGRPFDLPDGCYQLTVSPQASAWLTRRVPTPAPADDPNPTPPTVAAADLEPPAEQRPAGGDLTRLVADPDQPSYTATEQTVRLCLTRSARYRLQAVAATGGPVQQPAQQTVTLTRIERPVHDGPWPTGQRVARLVAGDRPSDHKLTAGCYDLAARRGAIGTLRRRTTAPSRPSRPEPLPWRTATVEQRFTACFDPQAVVALAVAYQSAAANHGAAAAEAALSDPELLADFECRWLEVGARVQVHGRPINAIVDASTRQVIEGITVYACADHACRQTDPSGPVPGALWFPLAMLRMDP